MGLEPSKPIKIVSSFLFASDVSNDSKSVRLPNFTGVTPTTTTMALQYSIITHQVKTLCTSPHSSSQSLAQFLKFDLSQKSAHCITYSFLFFSLFASDVSNDSKSVRLPNFTGVTPTTTTMALQCSIITHQVKTLCTSPHPSSQSLAQFLKFDLSQKVSASDSF
ncbi:hypothetical protein IGI04_017345 [Brassica rapa subsp. trilocularis]|uniref:BURP domain-containing protein n=1 Tax=Brassica rapa subsp. trilocularis TaxID=1813537 RepID=A0ABQ7MC65_BRACM|nr:hypothetical protein IGI04_017345 [Brassica rapa subsp. trilocularis]